jgi:protein SCO1/2
MSRIASSGITGDPAKVNQMVKDFRIYAKKVPIEGGDYTMDHTASVLLLNSAGDFFGTIAYEENSETALAKLKRLASEG